MTIDEVIKHCEEIAERQERASSFWSKGSKNHKNCLECAEEHHQLAAWLRELKQLREQMNIKADILDKIRKEIEELQLIGYATIDGRREIASRAVMQVIDKYKESEVK